jgi:hypothetical protein
MDGRMDGWMDGWDDKWVDDGWDAERKLGGLNYVSNTETEKRIAIPACWAIWLARLLSS